jgi:hypothetical protein
VRSIGRFFRFRKYYAGSAAAETAEVKSTSGYIQFSGMTERISIKTVFGNIRIFIADISDRIDFALNLRRYRTGYPS